VARRLAFSAAQRSENWKSLRRDEAQVLLEKIY
jgi:hypothetical protein